MKTFSAAPLTGCHILRTKMTIDIYGLPGPKPRRSWWQRLLDRVLGWWEKRRQRRVWERFGA